MKSSILRAIKKILKIITIMLLALIIIIFSSVFILSGTDKGFHFLMDQVSELSAGALSFAQLEGNLLGQLHITDLQYIDATMQVNVQDFVFNWQPTELFKRQLLVNKLAVNGVKYNQLIVVDDKDEAEANNKQEVIVLPDISLPVDIYLQKLHISDVTIISQPGAEAVYIDTLQLRSELIKTKLTIQELVFKMPDIQAQINGTAELQIHYPLNLQSDIKLKLPEQPELTLKGEITGDLQKLIIKQQLAGLLDASVNAEVRQLLDQLEWQSDIVLSRFELSPYMPENYEIIKAQINAKGDLVQAAAHIKTQIQPVSETKKTAAQYAQITLDTDITFENQEFKTSAQWQNLQWPLSGIAAFASKTGSLQISGIPDDYNLAIQLALAGSDLPPGDWTAKASGGLSQIDIHSLRGNTLGGTIDITSIVSWNNSTQWQAKLHTEKINPGLFAEQWPGSINFDLQTQGQLSGEELTAHIVLEQFSGHLRKQPLKGQGEIDLHNQSVAIKQFNLSSGAAQLEVYGKVDKQLDLNWLVDIQQLSDLLPDSQGSIHGQGHISGTSLQPLIKAKLNMNNIAYDSIQLHSARLNAAVNMDTSIHSELELSAQELSLDPDNTITQINLSLNGPLDNHHLKLVVKHSMAALNLDTSGKVDMEKSSWDGVIKQLTIDSPDFGKWSQTKPAALYASAEKVLLSSLCLKEQSTSLCTEADWTPEKGKARLNLKDLSFERAKAYLPEDITQLTGSLNLNADINLAPQLLADINAEIKPGKLIYHSVDGEAIELAHRNGLLKAQYNASQFTSRWNIEMGPHTLQGDLNIPRAAIEKDPATAPIKGQVKMNISDFNLLTSIVPQIDKVDGHLLADLKLGGLLAQPEISGHAELIAPYMSIHDIGLRLENISLTIDGKNNGKELAVVGSIDSGEGQLIIDGSVVLDAEQGWPVKIDLKGENFLAINIPDVYAIISPDIQFSQKKNLMQLRGKLLIPEATIAPSDMSIPEGSVSHSDDVIVVGEEEKKPLNMDLDLTLALGNKVKVDAYGLRAYLYGEITVNQIPRQIMTARGVLHLKNGTFRAFGQDLTIDKGKVYYAGGYLDNPGIELRATRRIKMDQVGINVSGSAKDSNVTTFADDPTLTEKDIVSLLLTGQKSNNLQNAKIYAGTQINEKLSVGINAGAGDEGSEFVTRYSLTDDIHLEGTSSSKKSGGSILYSIEFE